MEKDILLWGSGAIGGTIGATLKRAGQDVTFVDIVPEHVAAIRDPARGLKITGPVDPMVVTAPAFTPDTLRGRWKRVFLAVKAHHTDQACRALQPHLAADGYVVSLQNGLCEDIIAAHRGGLAAPSAPSSISAPTGSGRRDHVRQSRAPSWWAKSTDDHAASREVACADADLRARRDHTEDIWSYLWGKLGYGTLLFAQGICELGIADTLGATGIAAALARSRRRSDGQSRVAEGITPRGFNGFDPDAFRTGENRGKGEAQRCRDGGVQPAERQDAFRHLARSCRPQAADRGRHATRPHRRGRPKTHGIACPKLEGLIAMIHAVEDGKRALSDANLVELMRIASQ